MQKLTEEEFVIRAIKVFRKGPSLGIHRISSGFDDAFRRYFGNNPSNSLQRLASEGKIVIDGETIFIHGAPDLERANILQGLPDLDSAETITARVTDKVRDLIDTLSKAIILAINEIIKKDISKKIIGVTGNGPFEPEDIAQLVSKLGGVIDNTQLDRGKQDYIVIGRKEFEEEYLVESIKQNLEIRYFSQEDFINYLIFGVDSDYSKGDRRIAEHPGLSFLASIGFKWPTTASRPSQGGDFTIPPKDWPDESVLKEEYGYNVRIETTLSERRDSLRPAIIVLGLQKVATHIAAMVRLNKKRPDTKMEGAIQRWKEDLEWLKTEYYDQGNYRFLWPRH